MSCPCLNWCRSNMLLLTDHHENCAHYIKEVAEKSKEHLSKILNHFRDYCNEGDGVPPESWEDYKRALLFIGEFERYAKCLKFEEENSL